MDTTEPTLPPTEPRTDGKAVGSLVCGILSLACFSILTGIPAVILGHVSRSAIRNSMGRLKGEGMALAGLIMGYISIAFIPILLIIAAIAIPGLLRARQVANESEAVESLRAINTAEARYLSSSGAYGEMDDLVQAGLLDPSFERVKAGYTLEIEAGGDGYTARAIPATSNTGRYGFYSTTDAVIHYSDERALAPPGQAGRPIQ